MDYVFISDLDANDQEIRVTEAVAQHLKALRINDQQRVGVINGKGIKAIAHVQLHKKEYQLRVDSIEKSPANPRNVLALGILDHRDRFEFAIEKACELGATDIIPLHTNHVQFVRLSNERLLAKCVAACTQSGNPWVPLVHDFMTVQQALLWQTLMLPNGVCIVGDVCGQSPRYADIERPVMLMVGPEGGFSNAEQAMISQHPNVTFWAVGNHRLRAETAAIALLSIVIGLQQQ